MASGEDASATELQRAEHAAEAFERYWEGALADLAEEQRRHAHTARLLDIASAEIGRLRAQNGRLAARIGALRKLLGVTKRTDPTRRLDPGRHANTVISAGGEL